MSKQDYCKDANRSIRQAPTCGYCLFAWYESHQAPVVALDGEFDLEDIKRIADLLQHIEEESLK